MMKTEPVPAQKIVSFVNPLAARRKWKRSKKLRIYLERNLPGEIIATEMGKKDMIELVRAKSLEKDVVIVVGGDGTIADAIQGIVESGRAKDITLGIVPLGSGNGFRISLGIPKSVKKALKVLFEGEIKEIDLIDIEGCMTGIASIGATAKVTQEMYLHTIPGLFGHLLASKIMLTTPLKEHKIELFEGIGEDGVYFDRKILKVKLFDCIVGKTKYFGYSWKVAPLAKIDDGYLDVTLFKMSGLKYMLIFPLIYFGLYQLRQKHFKAKKMVIRGKSLPLQYNGEFLGVKDEFELKVVPRALKVICSPKKSSGQRV